MAGPHIETTAPPGFRAMTPINSFMEANGPLYERRDAEGVMLGFRVDQRHTNSWQACHGGWLASFCDVLMGNALRNYRGASGPTVSLTLHYIASAACGAWVEGRAQVLRTTRSLGFVQALVHSDGRLITRADALYKLDGRSASSDE